MLLKNLIRGVLREAAMGDGADAGGSDAGQGNQGRQQQQQGGGEKRPVHERLKAFLYPTQKANDADGGEDGEDPDDGETGELPGKQAKEPAKAPKVAPKQAQAEEVEPAEDTSASDEATLTSITELAEQTGLSLDRLLDLAVPAKVGGKDAKATIREMLKSYQTDQLLNTKLQTHAAEQAAWKTQQQQEQTKFQQNLQRMDAGLQVAQRMLQGEFSQVNWEALQQQDPAQYAQTLLGFQQRQAQLDQVAQQLGQERQSQQKQQADAHNAWLGEQKQLLEAKLPGWSDAATRKAAIQEIADVVGKAYGFDAEHLNKLTDHRDFLVLNDALKWQKLQASKAGVLNKVRTAPKLLKPGSAQSAQERAGAASTEARARVRNTGHVKDAASWLKSRGLV
jgi:hypothetical protein